MDYYGGTEESREIQKQSYHELSILNLGHESFLLRALCVSVVINPD